MTLSGADFILLNSQVATFLLIMVGWSEDTEPEKDLGATEVATRKVASARTKTHHFSIVVFELRFLSQCLDMSVFWSLGWASGCLCDYKE